MLEIGVEASAFSVQDPLRRDGGLGRPTRPEGLALVLSQGRYPRLNDPGLVEGEFMGGSDIVQEMFETGELQKVLGVE